MFLFFARTTARVRAASAKCPYNARVRIRSPIQRAPHFRPSVRPMCAKTAPPVLSLLQDSSSVLVRRAFQASTALFSSSTIVHPLIAIMASV